jgi:ribosomal protein S18 acetylase RimI-like enzyme
MNDSYWRKIKKSDFLAVEKSLMSVENDYVNACAKFIARKENNAFFWTLDNGKGGIPAVIINSGSNILPVLYGQKKHIFASQKNIFSSVKKIHSVQGLRSEVIILEDEIEKTGRKPIDIIDYDLMSLDAPPNIGKVSPCFPNLVLRTPKMTDIDALSPLQAAYEKEEVLPKGSTFSPASSRMNTANIIAKGQVLAAEVDGRLVGKINVSAVSFTRYQVGGVYVCPEFRGKGIARQMAYKFISSLISKGRGVTLFVRKTNAVARRIYSGLGFTVSGDYRITYY